MRERNDYEPVKCHATARGIVECLRMLAEEAASLDLGCTVRALWSAVGICERESSPAAALPPAELPQPSATSMN